jgi:hypothetical protein
MLQLERIFNYKHLNNEIEFKSNQKSGKCHHSKETLTNSQFKI